VYSDIFQQPTIAGAELLFELPGCGSSYRSRKLASEIALLIWNRNDLPFSVPLLQALDGLDSINPDIVISGFLP